MQEQNWIWQDENKEQSDWELAYITDIFHIFWNEGIVVCSCIEKEWNV